MSLKLCTTDVLIYIMSFSDNKSNSKLVSVCKELVNHGKENGYMTRIQADYKANMMEFLSMFCSHSKTISTVTMNGFENPHIWVPSFREKMLFTHCSFPMCLNPGKDGQNTKQMVITDYHRYKNKLTLKVKWENLPNLEELELYVYDVDMTGIDKCKKLKRVKINTSNYKIVGSNFWSSLLNPQRKRRRFV